MFTASSSTHPPTPAGLSRLAETRPTLAADTASESGLLAWMHSAGPWWAWALLFIAVAGLLVWTYLNFFAGLYWSLGYRLQPPSNDPETNPQPHASALPKVALLAPGRDEAQHLPHTLAELCSQGYPGPPDHLRVVFIDDASTDATPQITAAALERFPDRLTVVRNDVEPPAGWVGKCWALHRGVRQLVTQLEDMEHPTPWLCFTDADIHWHPQLLQTAMRHALEQDADVLTVVPSLSFGSRLEAIVQVQLMAAMGIIVPFHKAVDPKHQDVSLTAGAFILVKRELYDRIGGHEAVKGEVVEDLQIGRRFKREGAKMAIALAGDLQWCRMYDGPADLWEGLTKNAYPALDYSPLKAATLLIATTLLNIAPMPLALFSLVWLLLGASWLSAATFLAALATTLLQGRILNAVRPLAGFHPPHNPHLPPQKPLPRWYAWTMPIGNAAYSLIVIGSMVHAYTRGNAWKGRRYGKAA